MQILYPNTFLQALPLKIQKDEQFREFISNKLHSLDTGINKVSIENKNIELLDFSEKFNLPNEIVHEIEETQNGIFIFNGKSFLFKEGKLNVIKLGQIKFEHLLNGRTVNFDIDDESDGTKRLLDLLPILFKLENDSNSIYIIDELDRSLHTKLTKYFVEAFVKSSTDTQLVFTTHDINLLNLDIFRPEEIWFVEKSLFGETQLVPFSDFDVIEGIDILNDYLAGRFGAVPVIKEE